MIFYKRKCIIKVKKLSCCYYSNYVIGHIMRLSPIMQMVAVFLWKWQTHFENHSVNMCRNRVFVASVSPHKIQSAGMRIMFYSQLTTVGEVFLNQRYQKCACSERKGIGTIRGGGVFIMSYNYLDKIHMFLCKRNNRGEKRTCAAETEHLLYFTVTLAGPQLSSCMNKGRWKWIEREHWVQVNILS